MRFVVTKVTRDIKTVTLNYGDLTVNCRVVGEGPELFVLKPPHLFVENGRWPEFIQAIKDAWNEVGQ